VNEPSRPAGPSGGLDQHDAWVVAYPDHVTTEGATPLRTLAAFIDDVLHPVISGCHVLPLHPSSGDGGFSVIDASVVEPSFGSWADVERLAADCAWMADAVVNHVSVHSAWFRAFLAGEAPYDRYFATLDPAVDASAVTRARSSPLSHPFVRPDGRVAHVWTTFSADQADVDYTEPAVVAAMTDMVLRYARHGAAAIRLDAVGFVGKDPATSSLNLPAAHAVVAAFRRALDTVAPDVLLITETNVPQHENVAYLAPGEADAVYQFALPPLVAHAVLAADTGVLAGWLDTLVFPAPPKTFLNFLASHDGVGLRPVEGLLDDRQVRVLMDATVGVGGVVNERTDVDGNSRPYELAVSWFSLMSAGSRAARPVDSASTVARHLAAHAIALAVRGLPLLYVNSLFGVANDDDAYARTGHARDLNRGRLRRPDIDEALVHPYSVAAQVWTGLRVMLERRAASPAFHPASDQIVHRTDRRALMIERVAATGERALVVVNVAGEEYAVTLPAGDWGHGGPVTLASWETRWLFSGAG